MKYDTKPTEDRMQKTISAYSEHLSTIRAGRANPQVLSKVTVDYYGVPTPINQMAEVKATDPRTLMIAPWDATTLKDIERAIFESDVGITPANDGKVIRLAFPQLTEERRKELTKQISKLGEEAKVAIRNIRRDSMEEAKKMKNSGDMTEDEQKQAEKLIQDVTDKYIKEVDKVTAEKEKEIMAI
jgi:ribosome recycling factor